MDLELFNVYIETGRREKFMVCKNLNIQKVVGLIYCNMFSFLQTGNNRLCHMKSVVYYN